MKEKKNTKKRKVKTESNGFKCPYCAKKIKLGEDLNDIIKAYNNLKETINGIKLMIENIIKTSVNNPMNSQLKIVNITLNSINEDIPIIKKKKSKSQYFHLVVLSI